MPIGDRTQSLSLELTPAEIEALLPEIPVPPAEETAVHSKLRALLSQPEAARPVGDRTQTLLVALSRDDLEVLRILAEDDHFELLAGRVEDLLSQPEHQGNEENWSEIWLTRSEPDPDTDSYRVWGPADNPDEVPHRIDGESRRYLPATSQDSSGPLKARLADCEDALLETEAALGSLYDRASKAEAEWGKWKITSDAHCTVLSSADDVLRTAGAKSPHVDVQADEIVQRLQRAETALEEKQEALKLISEAAPGIDPLACLNACISIARKALP